MAQWLDAKVVSRTDWNDHLFSLRFTCPEFPQCKAGQFTKIGLELEGKILSRPYSLVNAPDDDCLEIIAVPVAEGLLSPKLHDLQVGDSLKVMAPPTGFLILDEVPVSKDLWLIATGTGVGPFISILSTPQAWQNYQNIVLVYGARWQHDLAYLPLISQWQEEYAGRFRFVPIVSREAANGCLLGRIPTLLPEIQQQVGLILNSTDSQVMLCGNPQMIEHSVEVLSGLGLSKHLRRLPGQISMERYW
ncbi:ferredoxin--NADP reductase [Paraglaciecola hydrolytica]|uniref:ferredoxin--NADP(+) reductase n=1 Tax=Paraglaciecola hydrolytica TaxID=1799789 RepID=A0A136A3F1_9ALTE|nr:ferredoxin--NADP reductase [Paraglaciecola hydrolytica]KXI29737.1 ferredoxin--NADP(+) reductase [Paraglaciecola hydrolytica]